MDRAGTGSAGSHVRSRRTPPLIDRLGTGGRFSAAVLLLISAVPARAAEIAIAAPVAPTCISSPFGPRVLPGKPLAGTYHWGVDLAAPVGAAVRAAAAGRVASIRRAGAGGLFVLLRHDGFATLYAHLGRVTPRLAEGGTSVRAGEMLGVIGRSGLSYGPHLYFELQRDGRRIDPAPYLALARCEASAQN